MSSVEYITFCLWIFLTKGLVSNRGDNENRYRCPQNLPQTNHLRTISDRCYLFINDEKRWNEARTDCQNKGGDLIEIKASGIQTFVEESLEDLDWDRNGMWIGLSDETSEGDWRWVSGISVNNGYKNWASGQPGGGDNENCANLRLSDNYKWHDYPCAPRLLGLIDYVYSYACQFSMSPESTLTSDATTTTTTTTLNITTAEESSTLRTTTTTITTSSTPLNMTTSPLGTTTTTITISETRTPTATPFVSTTTVSTTTNSSNSFGDKLTEEETGLSQGGIVGMSVGLALGLILGLLIGAVVCFRRFKRDPESLKIFNNPIYHTRDERPQSELVYFEQENGTCIESRRPQTEPVYTEPGDVTNIITSPEQNMTSNGIYNFAYDNNSDHEYTDIDIGGRKSRDVNITSAPKADDSIPEANRSPQYADPNEHVASTTGLRGSNCVQNKAYGENLYPPQYEEIGDVILTLDTKQ